MNVPLRHPLQDCPGFRCPASLPALAAFDCARTQRDKLRALNELVKIRMNYWDGYRHALSGRASVGAPAGAIPAAAPGRRTAP